MLLFHKFLLLAVPTVLLQGLTSVLLPVGAVPVPAPAPTNHAIAHSHAPPHPNQQHQAQVQLQGPHVNPTITHNHIVPNNGRQVHGWLPLQPGTQLDAHGHLPNGRLEAHGNHVAGHLHTNPAAYGQAPHGWEVKAHHNPGANHITFEAVPKPHDAADTHHIRLPGGQTHQAGHAVSNPQEHQAMLNHLHGDEQNGRHQHGQIVHANDGDHMTGTLRVPRHLRAPGAMTPGHLETNAHYVANHIAGIHHPQSANTRITVQHTPGSSQVHYHVHAPNAHLNSHIPIGPNQLGGSLNGQYPTRAFKGTVPKQGRTPDQPTVRDHEEYSAAIRHNLVQNHGAGNVAVASMQHPNGQDIMYRTQRDVVKSEQAGDHLHPFVQGHVQALVNSGRRDAQGRPLTVNGVGSHAEMHLVSDYLKAVGANVHNAPQHLAGTNIGVSGMGDKPCGTSCREILGQMGVQHRS